MPTHRILAVDDEPLNLAIIEEYLSEESCAIDTALNGEMAWSRLVAAAPAYDLVILDRLMPRLDGMALLQRMKGDERFADTPVIMQTAAAAPEQVREGIAAGAYYYLTKPYEPEALCAVVRAALADRHALREARARSENLDRSLQLLDEARFIFRTLEDVAPLATTLAALCPRPDRVQFGLVELMVNAIEHGNLGISYREKTMLLMENRWHEEVARRLALPEYRNRVARVHCTTTDTTVRFAISDEGSGFAWEDYLDFDASRVFDPNGRGIAMALRTSFHSLEYLDDGSTAVATVPRAAD